MEGVLTPEIWIAVSEKTAIPELRRTTRDEPDYDKLMLGRLAILDEHGLKLSDIQNVIGTLEPLPGGREFLDELRTRTGFVTDVSHVALHGRCQNCSTAATVSGPMSSRW